MCVCACAYILAHISEQQQCTNVYMCIQMQNYSAHISVNDITYTCKTLGWYDYTTSIDIHVLASRITPFVSVHIRMYIHTYYYMHVRA